ncbi:type-F conjugative transfer system protein TraW, partial [Acinetobacter baumannii]|uniref:type-F conjugative transfer system protein TraW n=1 Tax=Acinetobacter baumannii TaxID=470 RepID=UPI001C04FED6
FNSNSNDLGVNGAVYKIQEPDALEQIYTKLKALEKTGELKRKQQEAVSRAMNSAKNPKPVENISTVTVKKVRLFDPTMHLSNDIKTDEGVVVARAGTSVNPLDTVTMTKTLVLFKGSDPEQVQAVKKLTELYKNRITPILVDGSWFDLTRAWKRQVYFDQYGYISKRLQITSVPSIVRQNGKMLEISEVPAKELVK